MRNISHTQKIFTAIFFSILFSSHLTAFASSPVLNILPSGNGNDVSVAIINADPNAPIILYYNSTIIGGTQTQKIGVTDSTGSFGGSVSTNAYNISSSAPLYAVINGYQTSVISWPYNATSTIGALILSPSNPTISQGQSLAVEVQGGSGAYYLANNSDSNIAQVNLLGKNLSIYGLSPGKTTVQVCSISNSCVSEVITITGSVSQTLSPVAISVPVFVGKMITLPLSGGTGLYTLSSQNPSTFTAAISGNRLFVTGLIPGENSISVCSGSAVCGSIRVLVSNLPASFEGAAKEQQPSTTKEKYVFYNPLYFGMQGAEVLELQKRLAQEGYFYTTPNGYFGPATRKAVIEYQADHELSPFGNVGPATRNELNK